VNIFLHASKTSEEIAISRPIIKEICVVSCSKQKSSIVYIMFFARILSCLPTYLFFWLKLLVVLFDVHYLFFGNNFFTHFVSHIMILLSHHIIIIVITGKKILFFSQKDHLYRLFQNTFCTSPADKFIHCCL